MNPLHIETPLIESTILSKITGKQIFLKMESAQPTGSFKIRGLGRLCQEYAAQGAQCFVCPSGGNAGLATAYAAKKLRIPCKIVIPHTTPAFLKQIIEQEGAEVIVHGNEWNSADVLARELATGKGCYYVPPFDHAFIWAGNSSIMDEIVKAGIKPDAIALSVGGGGLFAGTVEGLKKIGSKTPIITVETEGADSFAQSLAAKKIITLAKIESIAVTLGCKTVATQAFALAQEHPTHPLVISDLKAVEAALRFADDHRVIVEPACGVTLSILYDNHAALAAYKSILVIVCGGAGVSYKQLELWRQSLKIIHI